MNKTAFEKEVQHIIINAIREDVGEADYSSLACIPSTATGKAELIAKEKGILAGVGFAKRVFDFVDPELNLEVLKQDGEPLENGDLVFRISGKSQSILKSERLMLNGLQRMSGIATKTHQFVEALKGTQASILDTRKTTPGIRVLEKWAVRIGGGVNHRFGLYDMIMLKDNHIDFAGGVSQAISKTKTYLKNHKLDLKIVVEARNLSEVREITTCGDVDRILIDNFSFEDTKKAIAIINRQCLTESSGGITLKTARQYAECGVDFISCGALTHSVSNLDLSLNAVK